MIDCTGNEKTNGFAQTTVSLLRVVSKIQRLKQSAKALRFLVMFYFCPWIFAELFYFALNFVNSEFYNKTESANVAGDAAVLIDEYFEFDDGKDADVSPMSTPDDAELDNFGVALSLLKWVNVSYAIMSPLVIYQMYCIFRISRQCSKPNDDAQRNTESSMATDEESDVGEQTREKSFDNWVPLPGSDNEISAENSDSKKVTNSDDSSSYKDKAIRERLDIEDDDATDNNLSGLMYLLPHRAKQRDMDESDIKITLEQKSILGVADEDEDSDGQVFNDGNKKRDSTHRSEFAIREKFNCDDDDNDATVNDFNEMDNVSSSDGSSSSALYKFCRCTEREMCNICFRKFADEFTTKVAEGATDDDQSDTKNVVAKGLLDHLNNLNAENSSGENQQEKR